MIGRFFRFLGMLDEIMATVTAVVAVVEQIGQVAESTGPQKRALAIERLRETFHDQDLPLSDRLLGVLIDSVVWVLNTVLPRWTDRKNEETAVESALQASARVDGRDPEGERGDDMELRREELAENAHREFERLEERNAGEQPPGRPGREGGKHGKASTE